ncbi:MAG: methyltransferase domain-containing protein [Aquabacterium sp.]
MPTPDGVALAQARTHFLAGVAAFESGRLDDAVVALEEALALAPGRPSVLVNLAATRLAQGLPELAQPLLEQALAAEPADAQAWCHHALALVALGRDGDSIASFDRSLALPDAPAAAAIQRALALRRQGLTNDALVALESLCDSAAPDDPLPWLERGLALQVLQRHDEAADCYRRACAVPDAPARAFALLGALLKDANRPDEARDQLREALSRDPADAVTRYLLASVDRIEAPPQSPASYVISLFDDYAERFDRHLVGTLGYQAPQRLADLLPAPRPGLNVLDLGCGTGLMAAALAARAGALATIEIDGVDLAPAMLAQARARGLYRHLDAADIAGHLAATTRRYDWMLATDVFIYIGALEAVFAGMARVLAPGGLAGFSLEVLSPQDSVGTPGWQLRPSARYAHSAAYVQELAAAGNWQVVHLRPGPLREDQRQPVAGLYVVLQRG